MNKNNNIEEFGDWPHGKDPATIGRKLARLFDSQDINLHNRHYKDVCAWYGSLRIAALINDQNLLNSLIDKYGPALGTALSFIRSSDTPNGEVDKNIFGIVPLEIYLNNNDNAYIPDGLSVADQQADHLGEHKRKAVDDMFMITCLQVQAYRASGKQKYLDTAAATIVEYLDDLQLTDGCFYQLPDNTVKWGRGNGWAAAGLTEIMKEVDPTHRHYPRILKGYKDLMTGLMSYQTESGLWRQILDDEDSGNWEETSGSAMFTFALVTGIKKGWIDEKIYAPIARKAWLALTDQLQPCGQLKKISNWCYFTTRRAYLSESGRLRERPDAGPMIVTGDNHGQAPMLWAAAAFLR